MSKNIFGLLLLALTVTSLGSAVRANAATSPSGNDSWDDRPTWMASAGGNGNSGNSEENAPRRARARDYAEVSPFAPGSHNMGIDVGQVFLMGGLASKFDDSIGAQAHYTYGVSELFGFDTSLGYSQHSEGKYSMTTLLTGLRTNLSWYDRVIPHLIFGLGFYKPSYDTVTDAGQTVTLSPLLFGVHLGAGVNLEISRRVYFGTSLTFHDVFGGTKPTSSGPIDLGGTFISFLLHAGVTF